MLVQPKASAFEKSNTHHVIRKIHKQILSQVQLAVLDRIDRACRSGRVPAFHTRISRKARGYVRRRSNRQSRTQRNHFGRYGGCYRDVLWKNHVATLHFQRFSTHRSGASSHNVFEEREAVATLLSRKQSRHRYGVVYNRPRNDRGVFRLGLGYVGGRAFLVRSCPLQNVFARLGVVLSVAYSARSHSGVGHAC